MPIYHKGEILASNANGKSAYEIAVENGFDGTEAEWLDSLRGEPGPEGPPGPGGASFTTDDTLTMSAENVLGVTTPVTSVVKSEFDSMTNEQKRGLVIVTDELPWTQTALSIQEYDTDDGWHVRKWSDGYVEMSITVFVKVVSSSVTNNYDTLFIFSGAFPPIDYPVPLVRRYAEIAVAQPHPDTFLAGWVAPRGLPNQMSLTRTMEYSYYRSAAFPATSDNFQCGANIAVTGRWK